MSMTNMEALKKRARSLGVRVTKSVNGRRTPKTENELRRHVEMAERKRENAKRETAAKRHGGGWIRNPFSKGKDKGDIYRVLPGHDPPPEMHYENVGRYGSHEADFSHATPPGATASEDSEVIRKHFEAGKTMKKLNTGIKNRRQVKQDGNKVTWKEGDTSQSLTVERDPGPNYEEM